MKDYMIPELERKSFRDINSSGLKALSVSIKRIIDCIF